MDITLFGLHPYVIWGVVALLILAFLARNLIRNLCMRIIHYFSFSALDGDVLGRNLIALMCRPLLWLSTAVAVGVVFFASKDVRQNETLALIIRIFLTSYVFYLCVNLSNLIVYVIPKRLAEYKIVLATIIRVVKALILFSWFVTILGFFGINTSAIVASLGISGAALAFAARGVLENLLAGFVILLESLFEIGDYIRIGTVLEGTVRSLRFHFIELESLEKTRILVPNALVLTNGILNFSKMQKKALESDIYLDWDIDQSQRDKVVTLIKGAIAQSTLLIETDSTVVPNTTSDGRCILHILTYANTTSPDGIAQARTELFNICAKVLEDNNIAFAFPRQLVTTTSPLSS